MAHKITSCRCVRLFESTTPFRFPANALVRCWMKIPMSPVFCLAKYYCRKVADGAFVRQLIGHGPRESANAKFLAKPRCVADTHFEIAARKVDLLGTVAA